jgi:hypothetical protein
MITPTQKLALQRAVAADGIIYRLPGGFWVSGTVRTRNGAPVSEISQCCNEVWCDVRTVRALEKSGCVERCNLFPDEWRDSRYITDIGRSAIL